MWPFCYFLVFFTIGISVVCAAHNSSNIGELQHNTSTTTSRTLRNAVDNKLQGYQQIPAGDPGSDSKWKTKLEDGYPNVFRSKSRLTKKKIWLQTNKTWKSYASIDTRNNQTIKPNLSNTTKTIYGSFKDASFQTAREKISRDNGNQDFRNRRKKNEIYREFVNLQHPVKTSKIKSELDQRLPKSRKARDNSYDFDDDFNDDFHFTTPKTPSDSDSDSDFPVIIILVFSAPTVLSFMVLCCILLYRCMQRRKHGASSVVRVTGPTYQPLINTRIPAGPTYQTLINTGTPAGSTYQPLINTRIPAGPTYQPLINTSIPAGPGYMPGNIQQGQEGNGNFLSPAYPQQGTGNPQQHQFGPGYVLGSGQQQQQPQQQQQQQPRGFFQRIRHSSLLSWISQQPLQEDTEQDLTLPIEHVIDILNESPPEPDPNNPFSVEAITALLEVSGHQHLPPLKIEVRRDNIVRDLIGIYRGMELSDAYRKVSCKFTGEEGVDAGGVMKDVYTTFWNKAKDQYFKGNIAFIPQISLRDYDPQVFVILGRIFSHSTVLLRAVPLQICRSTLNLIIYGEMEISNASVDTLIEDFLLTQDLDNRMIVQKALTLFDSLEETERVRLHYIFESFDVTFEPQQDTLKTTLTNIAYKELCLNPLAVCQKMGQGIPRMHRELFWCHMTLSHLDALYVVFRPTPAKVIEKLHCIHWPLRSNSKESKSFYNLKRFINGMTEETLLRFLQFVTAERKVPNARIMVRFIRASGATRAPKSHTCVNILELPSSYTKYEELKDEFTKVLYSEEAMQMNMA